MKGGRLLRGGSPTRYPCAPEFVFDNLDSLHQLRIVMDWSQDFIATSIGITKAEYNYIEYGFQFPTKLIYNRLAKLFEWEKWT